MGKTAEKPLAELAIAAGVGKEGEDISVLSKHADKEANPLYPVVKEMDAEELAKLYKEIDPQ